MPAHTLRVAAIVLLIAVAATSAMPTAAVAPLAAAALADPSSLPLSSSLFLFFSLCLGCLLLQAEREDGDRGSGRRDSGWSTDGEVLGWGKGMSRGR